MPDARCPKCNGALDSPAAACPHCGAQLSRSTAGRRIAMIAILTVVVASLAFIVKSKMNSSAEGLTSTKSAPPAVNVPELQARIAQGDAEAMNELGRAYMEGRGAQLDYKKAADLFKKAADLGHVDAQANLGMLYDAGQGVPEDPSEALELLKRAADQNHAAAAYNVGSIYGAGRAGIPQNIPESTKWYMKSAELGDSAAQYNVAQRYHLGVGVPIDLVEAYKWYELSARQGLPDSEEARDKLKKKLTREQLHEAMRRVERPTPYKPEGK